MFGRMARRFDLAVVRQAEPKSGRSDHLIIQAALFELRPPGPGGAPCAKRACSIDRVMICWDGGAGAAARAVADALPFLRRAKAIDLVTIGDQSKSDEISGGDMVDHLACHGLTAAEKRKSRPPTRTSRTHAILSHAAASSADLVVMGGYGHSRFREFVLGGATRPRHSRRNGDPRALMSH